VSAANPATKAPVNAEDMMSKNGLSVLKIKSETRWARMSLLLVLIQKHMTPHNKNNAINPVTKEACGVCGIIAATKNAAMAILHQGKYKHAQKLRSMVRIIEIINFIFYWLWAYGLFVELLNC
jgi:hypothetical protein